MHKIIILTKSLYLRFMYAIRNRKHRSVYFYSFNGQYSDSPRAISEALHELDPSIELIWGLNEGVDAPDYVTKIVSRKKAKKAQVQSDAWVMNNNSAPALGDYKGKNTFFVMTWHGDKNFKKIGWEAYDPMPERSKPHFELRDVDLMTSGCEFGVIQAHVGLHYYGEILVEGLPRNDKLVFAQHHSKFADEIRSKIGVSPNTKILLFAPTFRDNDTTKQHIQVNILRVIKQLEQKGDNWVCLMRAHSSSKGLDYENNQKLIDVSYYRDMADLLLISDFLITDYSSCAGDFVLTGRPCVLAQYDRDQYEHNSRSLCYNPDDTGFLIAKNEEELDTIINQLDRYDHKAISQKVASFYGTKESGQSSKLVAERIINWINKNHK